VNYYYGSPPVYTHPVAVHGYGVAPYSGYAVSPYHGYAVSPYQGYAVAPYQGYAVAPYYGMPGSGYSAQGVTDYIQLATELLRQLRQGPTSSSSIDSQLKSISDRLDALEIKTGIKKCASSGGGGSSGGDGTGGLLQAQAVKPAPTTGDPALDNYLQIVLQKEKAYFDAIRAKGAIDVQIQILQEVKKKLDGK
jgi:hypothetical protein